MPDMEIDICTMPQCSHPSSPTLMPKLGDYIAHTDRRRIKLPYDMLTDESPYWNNLDEQHRRTGFDAIETLADW